MLSNGKDRRFDYERDFGIKEFLGKKEKGLEVAGRHEFVGRRRQVQKCLKAFRDKNCTGILIHGLGRQGKSSLAARIANRLPSHDVVLIYGGKGDERFYKAVAVLEAFRGLTKEIETGKRITALIKEVEQDESLLDIALKELLEKYFSGKDEAHRPVLCIVDDLEKVLAPPEAQGKVYSVLPAYRPALLGLVAAFQETKSDSRLLLTGRYDFELTDASGKSLAEKLLRLPLPAMNETESEKQFQAKFSGQPAQDSAARFDVQELIRAGQGNPGLQNLLLSLFAESPESYFNALEVMKAYLESGSLPAEAQAVQAFLENLALDEIFGLLTSGERALLSLAALFDIPVPESVFDDLKADFIKKDEDYKKRLTGFGILEQYEDFVHPKNTALQLNRIAEAKVQKPSDEEKKAYASRILNVLLKTWGKANERAWMCDREILKFGLLAKNITALKLSAANAVLGMRENFLSKEAAGMAVQAVGLLEVAGENVSLDLYHFASDVCEQTGKVKQAKAYTLKAIDANPSEDFDKASSYFRLGKLLSNEDNPDEALSALEQAKALFSKLHAERESVISMGDIARLKAGKGELEEAQRLHEEQLEKFEKLGDVRSYAVTLWDLSQFLWDNEQFQEAFEYMVKAYQTSVALEDVNGISVVGERIGRLLVQAENEEAKAQGLEILCRSADAYQKLGQTEDERRVREVIKKGA